jgi:damage-control phosphatase, subfamily III
VTTSHPYSPKSIPWFVSDVTPTDFAATFTSLLAPTHFGPLEQSDASQSESAQSIDHLSAMVARWNDHLRSGAFALSVPPQSALGANDPRVNFWTQPYPYWDMQLRAPELFASLRESGLVVFKVRMRSSSRIG